MFPPLHNARRSIFQIGPPQRSDGAWQIRPLPYTLLPLMSAAHFSRGMRLWERVIHCFQVPAEQVGKLNVPLLYEYTSTIYASSAGHTFLLVGQIGQFK